MTCRDCETRFHEMQTARAQASAVLRARGVDFGPRNAEALERLAYFLERGAVRLRTGTQRVRFASLLRSLARHMRAGVSAQLVLAEVPPFARLVPDDFVEALPYVTPHESEEGPLAPRDPRTLGVLFAAEAIEHCVTDAMVSEALRRSFASAEHQEQLRGFALVVSLAVAPLIADEIRRLVPEAVAR